MNEILLRKLAKRRDMQNLFIACKEIASFRLFKNDTDLSQLQNIYLSYLFMYYNLNQDIGLKRVSEFVLNNEIYEDAYLLYRHEKGYEYNKKDKKHKGKIPKISLAYTNKITFPVAKDK
jgi:hypothetical protein